ncbi:hypothetical protein M3223_16035 [Paenibacillus pasadenensis]|uniref:hypothetical protein n=1 Tax=Paenibacillus pasadenensis TaxID=217090 RepID=UPI00203FC49F|nr:hypothetical protein [Paenibacillus pasadenensis]
MIALKSVSIPILVMAVLLSACSPAAPPKTEAPPSVSVSPAPTSEPEPSGEAERPKTRSFELMTNEVSQKMEAVLLQGNGFSLYVFEKFSFDAASGRLSLTSHPEYKVDIEPLPAGYDLAQLEATGKKELSKAGKVSDYSGELVEHPLRFAKLYLQASGENGITDFMVWTSEAGDAFLFRLHNPKGEEASEFAGPVLVSLSTILSDK